MGWLFFEEEASLNNFLLKVWIVHKYFVSIFDICLLFDHGGKYLPKMHLSDYFHYFCKVDSFFMYEVEVLVKDEFDRMPLK